MHVYMCITYIPRDSCEPPCGYCEQVALGGWGPASRTVSALTAEQSFLSLAPLLKVNRNVGSALDGCSE